MNLAIILEDNADTAARMRDIINRDAAAASLVQAEIVPYLQAGVKKLERVIANEACNLVLAKGCKTAFLVDLAAEGDDVAFGLEVIRQIANVLKPQASISDFLQDRNFFTIVVTVFGLNPQDVTTAWGAWAASISIGRIAETKNIREAIQTKAVGGLYIPVVYKPDKERLIPPLVNGWSASP